MIEKDDLYFKTNVQLKSIIGKDLINDDNIAILELVKNAFDADAKKVEIEFLNLKENDDHNSNDKFPYTNNTSRIIIHDNGVGMNLTDIRDKWLNIAYSEKKNNSRQHNRLMAGAKGVGRFSCDRLGEYLNLFSKKADSNTYFLLSVDWKAFEIENDKNLEIQSIPIRFYELSESDLQSFGIKPFHNGVLLEVIKLRSNWVYERRESNFSYWNVEKLIGLKKYLEKLINPNQAFVEDDFGIYISAPEFIEENKLLSDNEKFIGKVDNRIFEKLDFQSTSIESEIIDNGTVIYTELKDRGRTIFWIKERNTYQPFIKNSKVVLYYLSTYAKAFFTKQTGIRSVDYGSIFLFVNGFRVPPYGELGNDWLLLDQRKGQGYARFIGNRDIVGRVEILDKANDFQIISSREGVVRNDSYKKLVDQKDGYFYKSFKRLEKFVVEGLNWDSISDDYHVAEIEKKIISGEAKEEDLTYREDEVTKSRRVYSAIHYIISAEPSEVLELYINEDLISAKIAEEKEQSEREFQQLINDFENKKIDGEILERILQRKAEQNKELEKQLKEFSKYTTSEATSLAILDIQNYKKTIDDQQRLIAALKIQLENVEKEKTDAEAKAQNAQSEAQRVKEELIEVKTQNLFLKSVKSQDLDEVVSFMHSIGISATTIDNFLSSIYQKINRGIEISQEDLKKAIEAVSFENRKIISITRFSTKANFKLYAEDVKLDLVEFVKEYSSNILIPLRSEDIKILITDSFGEAFVKQFKPIEFSILIDNLLSNSIRAKAKVFRINFEKNIDTQRLKITFLDDGNGIKEEYIDKIFNFGFTTTSGSGLGLHHIQEIVKKLNASITVTNKTKGVQFTIDF